ncbi:hypothetical protein GCM10011514_07560 [Emticicia aquatilis]|uniref:Uncharacterized protein n=1 Tax=Emticicia aquatilis TaxID=1537369 RepID=A0A916YHM0_9BACT|nr:hypothetical protein [Emticicia aquatilis]GGD46037.1 hypothetical protein GCM10011514_07560 [Emticicia aquatilis]
MQKLASQIYSFLSQNIDLELISNPQDFPESPFDYLFYPEKNIVIHCVSFETLIDNPVFFQKIGLLLAQKNIKVIHLWEDIWQTKRAIVESRLMSLFGKSETLPARLTQVQRIDKPTLDKFLIDNHLQSKANAKLKYGLFLPKRYFRVIKNEVILHENIDNEALLVAVASFSNPKKFIREGQEYRSYEMIRFANHKGLTVVGGLNKLLKKFTDEHSPDDIMTYADADWSDGTNYEKIGFVRIELTKPLSFVVDDETLTRKLVVNSPHLQGEEMRCHNSGNWKFLMKLKQ